jgi:hypothetical protein
MMVIGNQNANSIFEADYSDYPDLKKPDPNMERYPNY